MRRKALLLGLLVTMMLFVVTTGWAGNGHKKPRPANKITDAAGRTHVRPTMQRVSDAQRKAAAQRRKTLRARSGRRATPAQPTPGQVR